MNTEEEPLSASKSFEDLRAWFDERAKLIEELTEEERERRRNQEQQARAEEQATRRAREIARRMQTIPLRFRDLAYELPLEVGAWVQEFLKGDRQQLPSLVLVGPNGVGKTAVACMVLRSVIEAEVTGQILFVPFRTLLRRLRPGGDATSAVVDELCAASLLCLDDLRAQKESEWTEEQLLEIVDHRYTWLRPMILTVDVPPAELSSSLGVRVARRLSEMCTVVAMSGPVRP